jgi:predicted nucleic-acid-binding Zn-ribbon protein
MAQTCVCDKCGYRPRATDQYEVTFDNTSKKNGVDEIIVLHVICYQCGYEWVE